MAPEHVQLQIFIQTNITMRKKKTKNLKEQPHLVTLFYKQLNC